MQSIILTDFRLYFLASFVIYNAITLFHTLRLIDEEWSDIFLARRISNLPLIMYLILFSFMTAFAIISYFKIKERQKMKKIENALRMLNEGQYSAKIFLKMFSEET